MNLLGNKAKPKPPVDFEEPVEMDDNYYDYDYSNVEPDNSRWELETEDVIERLEHSLKSEKKDPKTNQWFRPKNIKPKMNDIGVNDTIADIRGLMHKGTFLANVDHNYAVMETKYEARAFMAKLRTNIESWQVDHSQFKSLVLQYARICYMSYSRPIGDLERRHRNKRYAFKEDYRHNEVKADEIRL